MSADTVGVYFYLINGGWEGGEWGEGRGEGGYSRFCTSEVKFINWNTKQKKKRKNLNAVLL